jgi:hypothetical protein
MGPQGQGKDDRIDPSRLGAGKPRVAAGVDVALRRGLNEGGRPTLDALFEYLRKMLGSRRRL